MTDFKIDSAAALNLGDLELVDLLSEVFVGEGFTELEKAKALFEPCAVRQRGRLIAARETGESQLAGMVITVPPDSPARRLAEDSEVEMHLLAVKPLFRRCGLGRMLVNASLESAKRDDYSKMLLWTQTSMHVAQRLYESSGFVHLRERGFNEKGREFRVYECLLTD